MSRGRGCLEFIQDLVIKMKRKYSSPYIVVGGDFNQWAIDDALVDFEDIKEAEVGPTRGDRCLDRLFVNFPVTEAGTAPPLETDDSQRRSDHLIAYLEAELERASTFQWITYTRDGSVNLTPTL